MRRLHPDWITAAALACITWIVFAPALDGGFVNLDDFTYVSRNKYVTDGLSLEALVWAFKTKTAANWHPLTWLSLQLDATLWGSGPRGFHRTNVIFHGLNTALVFLVLRRMTGCFWRSATAALLFAVHPLRVESVAWISERKDVLSIFFGLLALLAYVGYARRPSVARYGPVALALIVSLLCKPTLVTLPFLMLVLDWWPLRRVAVGLYSPASDLPESEATASLKNAGAKASSTKITKEPPAIAWPPRPAARVWLRLVAEKLPLVAIVVASSVVTYLVQEKEGAVMELTESPPVARVANVVVSYGVYLAKTVWPTRLAALYAHPGSTVRVPETTAAGLVLVAFTVTAVALRRRSPYLLTGWLWYLGTLVPVIGLVQVGLQAYADRYTYFPQIGLMIALCWGVADLARGWQQVALSAAAVTAVVLAALTVSQIGVWHDSLTLWEHTLRAAGESATAYANLAETLENQGRIGDATRYYGEAVRLGPNKVQAHVNLGNALQKQGRLDDAATEFEAIINIAPDSPVGYTNLGLLRLEQKRRDEAAKLLDQATERRPDSEKNQGYVNRASVEEERNDFAAAADYYRRALDVQPDDSKALAGLGVCLLRLGKQSEGVISLRKSVAVDPDFARGHYLLGAALCTDGDLEGAAEQFMEEIRVSTNKAKGWYNLGIVRRQQKRLGEAFQCFAKSLQYDPSSPECRRMRDEVQKALQGGGQAP